jgi:23S rRNA pseudouridine1911/1915/1917 synthase
VRESEILVSSFYMVTVIYEDNEVVVVNKPWGTLVHKDTGGSKEETVVDWFLKHSPASDGVGEVERLRDCAVLPRSGVVHRLDRETSGVMILAKTQEVFLHLKAQFQERLVEKEYRAFVYGTMKEKWGKIERSIGRSSKDFRLRSAQRGARGLLRPAVTNWELIEQGDRHAYLRVMPKTGRTHQIRVHLKAVNHPIVCDQLYAPTSPCELGFGRLALHAYSLGITLPSGETKHFVADLPTEFVSALKNLHND